MLSVWFRIPQTGGAAAGMQLSGALASRDGGASITGANVSSARSGGGQRHCDTQPRIPSQQSRQDADFRRATRWKAQKPRQRAQR